MTAFVITQLRQTNSLLKDILIVIGSAILITLFGPLSFPLPFSPVPLATQGSFCLLLGILLGSRRASLAVLLFLFEGAMGLPVFSLGKSGLLHLMGPTGGCLMGTFFATYLAGFLYEKSKVKGAQAAFSSMLAANLLLFFCGWSQLSLFLGCWNAFLLGVLPFLLGDFIKLVITTKIYSFLKK